MRFNTPCNINKYLFITGNRTLLNIIEKKLLIFPILFNSYFKFSKSLLAHIFVRRDWFQIKNYKTANKITNCLI